MSKMASQRRALLEKPSRVVKSKKPIWPAPPKIFHRIESRQPLSGDEAQTVAPLRTLMQKKNKVVVISGAGIFVNAGSESLLVLLASRV